MWCVFYPKKQCNEAGTITGYNYRWANPCWENEVIPKVTQLVGGHQVWIQVFLSPELCSEILFTSFSAHKNRQEVLLKLQSSAHRDSDSDPESLKQGSGFYTPKSTPRQVILTEVVSRAHFWKCWNPCSVSLVLLCGLLCILKMMATISPIRALVLQYSHQETEFISQPPWI